MLGEWITALVGGMIIGIAVSVMLVLNGRVTGISGIVGGLLSPKKGDLQWRFFFVGGLLLGGLCLMLLQREVFSVPEGVSYIQIIAAGLLVGFGTLLGSGCTSGHGVCGISRLSMRSIIATVTFIGAGVMTVLFIRFLGGM